ncbi:putative sulfate exporter family transporter [Bacillus sp. CLL-7-23]|uniref:Sulfate exporter family transporter n=1 Tax=Bacillus changyiensis TaxID=3004103 RepID=A0ABT4X3Y8_9BACI|nr:putative sulfate exporter family transporter [Bacillus changyiensis]MDA7026151.1 putative sulfate exporter family transporter [Bacillus changyiensis]
MNSKIAGAERYQLFWFGGVGFTFILAGLGFALAFLPGLNRIGPMACSILLAVLYRQFFQYPILLKDGIQFVSSKILRFAIILYGLKLNIDVILQQGVGLLVKDAMVITFVILATVWLGQKLKADASVILLLGIGTGVCGAAAIAAVSPIVKSKEDETAMSVGIIALAGTIFSIVYTILRPILPLSPSEYGMWSGMSLHEIAHVALAGAPAGEKGLALALVVKLGRVLLLVPLSLFLIYWMKRKHSDQNMSTKIDFPWFLIGFLLMSLFGSFVLGKSIYVSSEIMNGVSTVTTFLLTSAMVGLGLNISLRELRKKALRPVAVIFIVSIALSIVTFLIV